MYLSKSDYKAAHECLSKLYFKKKGYPSLKDADEYMKFLAQGGYMVGKLATLYYPEGIEINTAGNYELAVQLTEELLRNENVTLFEAALLSDDKLIRVDILKKTGNIIEIIEVKSKSYDPELGIRSKKYEDLLYDVGFQFLVTQEVFPECDIHPFYLCRTSQSVQKLTD